MPYSGNTCEHCRDPSQHTRVRISDEWLCNECEHKREHYFFIRGEAPAHTCNRFCIPPDINRRVDVQQQAIPSAPPLLEELTTRAEINLNVQVGLVHEHGMTEEVAEHDTAEEDAEHDTPHENTGSTRDDSDSDSSVSEPGSEQSLIWSQDDNVHAAPHPPGLFLLADAANEVANEVAQGVMVREGQLTGALAQLTTSAQLITQLYDTIAAKDNVITAKDRVIMDKDNLLTAKDSIIRKLEIELQARSADLRNAMAEIGHQSALAEERSNSLSIERSLRMSIENKLLPKKKSLILSTSLIRDFDESLYEDTEIMAISGGKPVDCSKFLQDRSNEETQYARTVLLAGGNQVRDDRSKIEDTINALKETIKIAQSISDTTELCELPPRINSVASRSAVSELNTQVEQLATETGCAFIKTEDIFTLSNGEVNDGYLEEDGIHLSLKGAAKLAERMKISFKDPSTKVHKLAAYKRNKISQPQNAPQQPSASHTYADVAANGPHPTSQNRHRHQNNQQQGRWPNQQQGRRPNYQQQGRQPNRQQQGRQPNHQQQQGSQPNHQQQGRWPNQQQQGRRPAASLPIHPRESGVHGNEYNRHSGGNAPAARPLERNCCGYCAEPDHRYGRCRHGRPVVCHNCHQPGHKAKFCTQ